MADGQVRSSQVHYRLAHGCSAFLVSYSSFKLFLSDSLLLHTISNSKKNKKFMNIMYEIKWSQDSKEKFW